MVWGCFSALGSGRLAVINGTMNSAVYQKILKENVRQSVCDLKLINHRSIQQEIWKGENTFSHHLYMALRYSW